jgi:hypothetical protein
VLVGAWQVLSHGLCAEDAWVNIMSASPIPSKDPSLAWDKFPRPFTKSGKTTASCVTVLDCLQGLELAKALGWFGSRGHQGLDIAEWEFMRHKFDASWVIPGEVLAMANPWETAKNPAFPGLLKTAADKSEGLSTSPKFRPLASPTSIKQRVQSDANSICSGSTDADGFDSSDDSYYTIDSGDVVDDCEYKINTVRGTIGIRARNSSLIVDIDNDDCFDDGKLQLVGLDDDDDSGFGADHTPPVTYDSEKSQAVIQMCAKSTRVGRLMRSDYASFFLQERIGKIFRLNFMYESPAQDGYLRAFRGMGIHMFECAFTDGGNPSKKIVNSFLEECRMSKESNQPIAVHCMAGLGRTGVLLGTYAAEFHNMPGTAFHGWIRMCRPGSIQTEEQELFLRRMVAPRKKSTSTMRTSSSGSSVTGFLKKVASIGSTLSFGSN